MYASSQMIGRSNNRNLWSKKTKATVWITKCDKNVYEYTLVNRNYRWSANFSNIIVSSNQMEGNNKYGN